MCDWKVSKFFMCDKNPSPASFGFIMRMPTCPVLDQLSIFKVVQHAEV